MSDRADRSAQDENPYASPQVVSSPGPEGVPDAIWSHGDLVVAHRNALWPKICVLTGRTCDIQLDFPLATQYPGWLLAVFVVALVGSTGLSVNIIPPPYGGVGALAGLILCFVGLFMAIGYLAMPRQLSFHISNETYEIRKKQLRQALALNIIGATLIVAGIVAGTQNLPMWITIAAFVLGLIVIGIGGSFRARWRRILHPTKMHHEYTVLRGAGKPFLNQLPPWPYGPV
jgi:hypothetical protein